MPQNFKRDIIDHFYKSFSDPDFKLPPDEEAHLTRLKAVFTRWLENPLITDLQMRDYIVSVYGLSRQKAYDDIHIVKACFGCAPKADKEFQRQRANHILEQAAASAMAGDDKQAKALTKIAETIVKANRLDEPEGEEFPWDDIIPKDESFSVDPEVIGIKKVPNVEKKARELLARYERDIEDDGR